MTPVAIAAKLRPSHLCGRGDVVRKTGWLKVPIGGREFKLAVDVYQPPGAGPFPLVVINHGIPVSKAMRQSRLRARRS